jgi:hypothetical protein
VFLFWTEGILRSNTSEYFFTVSIHFSKDRAFKSILLEALLIGHIKYHPTVEFGFTLPLSTLGPLTATCMEITLGLGAEAPNGVLAEQLRLRPTGTEIQLGKREVQQMPKKGWKNPSKP